MVMIRKSPNLLFVAATVDLMAGGEISQLELIKGAVKRGYTVHVVLPGSGRLARALKDESIPSSVIAYTWWNSNALNEKTGPVNVESVGRIFALAKRLRADCVITNTLNVPWGAFAAALADIPHIWIAREFTSDEFSYLKDKLDFVGKFSNSVLANSKQVAEHIKPALKQQNIKHFYSYVDDSKLEISAEITEPRIVNLGHIQPRKNQLELVKAVGILEKKYKLSPDVLLIGNFSRSDKYFQKLRAEISNQKLKNVKIIGYSPQAFKLVRPNDIFVQASRSESIGRTTIEAMKLGLICIGGDIPGTKEAFELGGGRLYQSGNPADLAKVVNLTLKNFKVAQQEAALFKKKVLHNLSEQACHDPFFAALNRALGTHNPVGELRHLAPYIENSAEALGSFGSTLRAYEETIKKYDQDLANIVNSRSWKAVLKLRKLTYWRGSKV